MWNVNLWFSFEAQQQKIEAQQRRIETVELQQKKSFSFIAFLLVLIVLLLILIGLMISYIFLLNKSLVY